MMNRLTPLYMLSFTMVTTVLLAFPLVHHTHAVYSFILATTELSVRHYAALVLNEYLMYL